MGHDPREELRDQILIRHTNTVEAVMGRFIEKDAKRAVVGWQRIARCLELHILPVLGNRPFRDVRRGDVHDLLDAMVEDEGVGNEFCSKPLRFVRRYQIQFTCHRQLSSRQRLRVRSNPIDRDHSAGDRTNQVTTDVNLILIAVACLTPCSPKRGKVFTGKVVREIFSAASDVFLHVVVSAPCARHSEQDHTGADGVNARNNQRDIVVGRNVKECACAIGRRQGGKAPGGFYIAVDPTHGRCAEPVPGHKSTTAIATAARGRNAAVVRRGDIRSLVQPPPKRPTKLPIVTSETVSGRTRGAPSRT